ncbi:hypothetical protein CCACVL1_24662 [Corchorus capsularis]|uniref:Uncharacterized protein n=1 Tax=Corchorus capsularis TaxID=210143 RepID=A0A1R3GNP8_COCAP|nr:hypothetical protein CCACVL1_24662 [Corchorus capsularis]
MPAGRHPNYGPDKKIDGDDN